MRRDLRTFLAALLAAWIPVDSVFAGWWHHHHRGTVVIVGGPVPMAPCGPPAPWAGWEHAVIIDDRPLVAPAPRVFVVAAPVVEVIHPIERVVVEDAVHEEVIVAGFDTASAVIDACRCDTNDVGVISDDGAPIVADGWTTEGVSEAVPDAASGVARPPVTPVVEAPTPADATPPSAPVDPSPAPASPEPEPQPPAEPPVTLPEEEEPEAPPDDETMAESSETPAEESGEEERAATEQSQDTGAGRNLFDEVPDEPAVPADEPMADDDLPPEAFERPAGDDGFEFPADPPIDDASGDVPVDDMPPADEGFEGPTDEGAPGDEGDGFEEGPADMTDEEQGADEAPAADPFDSGSLHTPGTPSRTWRDDTGRHSTTGRLVEIRATSVRILKATGRHTTVPLARLSDADRAHVAGLRKASTTWSDTAGLR